MKNYGFSEGGFLKPKDAWDALSMKDKADMIGIAVRHGITTLSDIRDKYNEFAEEGGTDTDWSYNSWKKQIAEYMGIKPDEDITYDYEAYFKKYPEEAWKMLKGDPTAHFSDEFKTVYHPTFSSKSVGNDGSIYSGIINPRTNPQGLVGGTWSSDYKTFTMSPDGYRGPVNMDDRKWYLENAEDNGVQLREADGSLPIYDGIPWGGVLPNVTVYGKKHSIGGPLVEDMMNEYRDGGGIHIKDSKKGTFTTAAKKHGKSVQAFASQVLVHPENYSPAMRKKANFARNASHWKHGDGGFLLGLTEANEYGIGGDIIKWFKGLFSSEENDKKNPLYRGKPAEVRRLVYPDRTEIKAVPRRLRHNTSKTRGESEKYERQMRAALVSHQEKNGGSNPAFDIPFMPSKSILLGSTTTSTNALDTLAKYAAIHNANPQLSENPIMPRYKYKPARQINKNEMLGLSFQETSNGAWPYINTGHGDNDRAIANSNYFTAFGYIPADNFMRNYHYNDTGVDRETPPVLDAFRYFAQGDYNRGDKNHTKDVNASGERAWQNPGVINWWNTSDPNAGKNLYDYWYKRTRENKK